MSIQQHIEKSTGLGGLAVFTIPAVGARFEVGRGLSGYAVFRYSGAGRLVVQHSGMTLQEATGCVARWIAEFKD